jgi:hypothetical protein
MIDSICNININLVKTIFDKPIVIIIYLVTLARKKSKLYGLIKKLSRATDQCVVVTNQLKPKCKVPNSNSAREKHVAY